MTTTEQMAQVLEDAADMYESEKVSWCAGTWGGNEGEELSVCASTALGLAAGLGWLIPCLMDEHGVTANARLTDLRAQALNAGFRAQELRDTNAFRRSAESLELYSAVREEVDRRLTGAGASFTLPEFNDADKWDDDEDDWVPARTKQEIIDLFKDTAKELRNAQ